MRKRPVLTGRRPEELFATLADSYELRNAEAFYDLQDELTDITNAELADPDEVKLTAQDLAIRRSDAHALALRIRDSAAETMASLDKLHADLEALLYDTLQRDERLINAVFDDPDTQGGYLVPRPLREAIASHSASGWEPMRAVLQALAALRVRPALDRGPVRVNLALHKAVVACRKYWTEAEAKPWSMYRLKETRVRADNDRADLTGVCETFVADMLAFEELPFTLQELSSAWQAVDQRLRKAAAPPGESS